MNILIKLAFSCFHLTQIYIFWRTLHTTSRTRKEKTTNKTAVTKTLTNTACRILKLRTFEDRTNFLSGSEALQSSVLQCPCHFATLALRSLNLNAWEINISNTLREPHTASALPLQPKYRMLSFSSERIFHAMFF